MQQPDHSNSAFLGALLFGLVGVIALGFLTMRVESDSTLITLVFPSDFSEGDALAAVIKAAGSPLNFGISSNILIAKFDHSNHDQILEGTGASLILPPNIPGICSPL